jgi:hypothetical protein
MRGPVIAGLSAVCFAAAALTSSADASANYFALAWNPNITTYPDAARGIIVDLRTDDLESNCSGNFVSHEMWYGVDAGPQHWVEYGIKIGETGAGTCLRTATNYWADNNQFGYFEHYLDQNPLNGADQEFAIELSGACSWNIVSDAEGVVGTSTSNCPGDSRYAAAGLETTTQSGSARAKGFSLGWEEINSSGQVNAGWDGITFFANNPPDITIASLFPEESEEVLNESF